MPARAATPLDLHRVSALLAETLHDPAGIMASAVPAPLAAETFFQAGFYSCTRETWFIATRTPAAHPSREVTAREAASRDAHDLYRFYTMTTPHAVQRAEQLSFSDFDVSRRGGAYDPPHLIGGTPL